MVTDRRRLAAPAGRETPEQRLLHRVAAAARAGVHLVQVRERDLDGGPLFALVQRCLDAVAGTSARVIVNDRVDVALAAGAHGVHLRGASMPASRVRRGTPKGFLIGRSVHGSAEARAAEVEGGLDYLVFGPVFATRSKPDAQAGGEEALGAVVRAVSLPVLAVGGVEAATTPMVARAGAAGYAAIGMFADGADEEMHIALSAGRDAFDSPQTLP
jgi:thiamine-phosphate pyrophosphorylase